MLFSEAPEPKSAQKQLFRTDLTGPAAPAGVNWSRKGLGRGLRPGGYPHCARDRDLQNAPRYQTADHKQPETRCVVGTGRQSCRGHHCTRRACAYRPSWKKQQVACSLGGHNSALVMVDDFSRFVVVELLHRKMEVSDVFRRFCKQYYKPRRILCDNEFAGMLRTTCAELDIILEPQIAQSVT